MCWVGRRTGSCLFLGTGGAAGPGTILREQAVYGAALLAAASGVGLATQLGAAAPPVVFVILKHSGRQPEKSCFPPGTMATISKGSPPTSDDVGLRGCRFESRRTRVPMGSAHRNRPK